MKFAAIVITALLAVLTNASPMPGFFGADDESAPPLPLDPTQLASQITTTGGKISKGDWTKGFDFTQFLDIFKFIWEQCIQVYIAQGLTKILTTSALGSSPGGIPNDPSKPAGPNAADCTKPPAGPDASDAKVPDATAPDANAADAKAPDAKAPDAKAPDAKAPDAKAPNAKVPDSKAPKLKPPKPRNGPKRGFPDPSGYDRNIPKKFPNFG